MSAVADIVNTIKRGRPPTGAGAEMALAEIDEVAKMLNLSPAWKPWRAVVAAVIGVIPAIVGIVELVQAAL